MNNHFSERTRYSDTDMPDKQGRWAREVYFKDMKIAYIYMVIYEGKKVYITTLLFPTDIDKNKNLDYEKSLNEVYELFINFINKCKE